MENRKPFNKNTTPQTGSFLDQLNLPPGFVFFVEKYKKTIIIMVVLFLVTVISIPIYNSWQEHRRSVAATALATAMHLEGSAQIAALEEVSKQYTTTPSGLWAMVTLAQIKADQGELASVISQLLLIRENISSNNPLEPLLIVRMAGLNEELKNFEEAIALYQELTAFPGFVADAYYSLGRVYAVMGKKSEAIAKYQQYLAEIDKTGRDKSDSHRVIVEKTIKALLETGN
jgi:predicted negative regulator of RcsB-dependent stress response